MTPARSALIAALVLTSVLMVGCSRFLEIALFNNAGETVMAQPTSEKAVISPGQFVELKYPGENENWTLTLSTKACDYGYAVPQNFEGYSRGDYRGPVKVQLEKNFAIYLLPNDATVMADVEKIVSVQTGVFPLQPASKVCR